MIEGYSFVSTGLWCKFFHFFKFLIVLNYFLFLIITIFNLLYYVLFYYFNLD